jgi:hypothetical protein
MNAALYWIDPLERVTFIASVLLRVSRASGAAGCLGPPNGLGHALGPRVAVPGQQQVRLDTEQRVQRGERLGAVLVQPVWHDLRADPAGERVLHGQHVAGDQDRRPAGARTVTAALSGPPGVVRRDVLRLSLFTEVTAVLA